MKTITYNPDTHRLVPVEPNNTALDLVDPGFGTRKEAWERILASFPQPEPVEVEPVAKVDMSDEGQWADILPDRSVKLGQLLYTAPPDYEEIKRQWDELAKALEWIASSLPQIGVERTWMLNAANKALASVKGGAE